MDRRPSFTTLVALALLAVAVASRVIPHPWNFTPMMAVALFGGARLADGWIAALAVLACLALGDVAVGVFPYDGMWWVYGAMLAVVAIGPLPAVRPSPPPILLAALPGPFPFSL